MQFSVLSTAELIVEFNTTDVEVNERDGTVQVCLRKNRDTAGPFPVNVTAREKDAENPAQGQNCITKYSTLPRWHIGMLFICLLYMVLPYVGNMLYISQLYPPEMPLPSVKHLFNSCITLSKGIVWRVIIITIISTGTYGSI